RPQRRLQSETVGAPEGTAVAPVAAAGTAAAAEDVRARAVERQGRNAPAEIVPDSVLRQILLDVREIEGLDRPTMISDILADGTNRFRPAEVPHDRDQ